MNADRMARLREITVAAAALPEDERGAYLDRACQGDHGLRSEAESLLAHAERTPDLLKSGAMESRLDSALGAARPSHGERRERARLPETIGPFRILDLLGEGGMGVVYRAEQMEPIRREVALKLIRADMDSAGVLARFESERQTLAQMDHPNIARVLNAGSDDSGRPWFAMELVRGVPITEHCRSNRLAAKDRIQLFLDVCGAVRHAHRRGIIHRDLKPSNIMVTMVQGRPVPKVIDFSIAKALDDPSIGTEHRTRTGQVVGTLDYMSPEQARGAVNEIDTRSDVYALGVVLYELLTERLPLAIADLPLHEAVRRIVEDSPASIRKTLRGSTTASLHIDIDVATIVDKCLDKDPDRRYGSAAELAEDVERFLASRPISARRPSAAYQFRKLVSRHRVLFGAAALLFLFLLVYGVTVSVQLREQRRQRARADAAAEDALRAAARAERTNQFLQDLLAAADPADLGREVTVVEVLDRAAAQLDAGLADDPEVRADALATLARVYSELGRVKVALPLARRGLEIRQEYHGGDHPDLVKDLSGLANLLAYEGDLNEVRILLLEAIEMRSRIADEPDPGLAELLADLSVVERRLSHHDEAERVAQEAVAMWEALPEGGEGRFAAALLALSNVRFDQGRLEESIALSRRALDIATRELGPRHPKTLNGLNHLGATLYVGGTEELRAEALLIQRDLLHRVEEVYGPDHFRVAAASNNLAVTLMEDGFLAEAAPLAERALKIWLASFGADHPNVATAHNNLAFVQQGLGEFAKAEAGYLEALAVAERSGEAAQKLMPLRNIAMVLHAAGRYPEALQATGRLLQHIAENNPGPPGPWIRMEHGCLLGDSGRYDEAKENLTQSLIQVEEGDAPRADELGTLARNALARVLARQGDWQAAKRLLEEEGAEQELFDLGINAQHRHPLQANLALFEERGEIERAARYREALDHLEKAIRQQVPDPHQETGPDR